ncbi:MD-2-related lipid-recognition protein-like [Lutzomyia longipalpis]|uniref:MD-2-related lipid-recognition protein-like n=1 Tax=Lutzomyia longipalpis TaxID=7200 RepID=UPI00248390E9|nr:MD-2-related lipid-recognition protein-like [Lutzomyia longipalpis]
MTLQSKWKIRPLDFVMFNSTRLKVFSRFTKYFYSQFHPIFRWLTSSVAFTKHPQIISTKKNFLKISIFNFFFYLIKFFFFKKVKEQKKMFFKVSQIGFILSIVLCLSAAELVRFQECEEKSELACTIHAVRINPCPEAANDLPCKIKRGRSASIEFDYSSEFRATELDSRVYWSNEGVDLPLIGVDTNGCNIVTCPIEANINNTYTWTLNVSKKFPIRQFDIKMKIKNEDENFCCFLTKIRLTK